MGGKNTFFPNNHLENIPKTSTPYMTPGYKKLVAEGDVISLKFVW
jgi:hypothetical protein